MRLQNWFISNLDDSQRNIVASDVNKSMIVQGAAGSGKTNLAIHRASQASISGSYAIVIFTIALRRMVAYGMKALGLDSERIAYEWQWLHRGYDLDGFAYLTRDSMDRIDRSAIYLVTNDSLRKFIRIDDAHSFTEAKEKEPSGLIVGVDFGSWVSYELYCAYGRRTSFFIEDKNFNEPLSDRYELIPDGILYREADKKVDYLIIDEAQDFDVCDYTARFNTRYDKSITLFGDSAQMIYGNRGASLDKIQECLQFPRYCLTNNYRLPKATARMVQDIPIDSVDLLSSNMKARGNSDYPVFPKPVISQFSSKEEEVKSIINQIRERDLDDVAILVPSEDEVRELHNAFEKADIPTQVFFRTSKQVPFKTINTLDFRNNEVPTILTYHAAKGTEFDNVFVPFASRITQNNRKAFYVACTRTSRSLFISYSGTRTDFLSKVKEDTYVFHDYTKKAIVA